MEAMTTFLRLRFFGALFGAAAVAGSLFVAASAHAQAPPAGSNIPEQISRQQRFDELQQLEIDNRLRADTDVPPEQRALIDFGGYETLQYLSVDDRQDNNHGLREADLVLYGRVNLDAANEVFARARLSFDDFNRGDVFEGLRQGWNSIEVERAYYRFDLSKYEAAYKGTQLPYNVTFEGGRDLVYWANGLVLGDVLDGGIFDLSWKGADLQIIAGVTAPQTVDIDTSRPAFAYNTERGFYGAMLSYNISAGGWGQHKPFVYALVERDYNSHNFLQQGMIATKYDYNASYLGFGSTGSVGNNIVYGAEMAFEGGNTLSNSYEVQGLAVVPVPQTRNDIAAFGADYRIDYLLNDPHNSRFSFETILASGDPDRINSTNTFGGNRPGTKDISFNGFGLLNTGLAFAPEVSNLLAFRAGASTYPLSNMSAFRRMQIGADFFLFDKLQKNSAFDEGTTDNYYLGWEPDAYLNWQVASDVTLALRYGIFFPSSTIIEHQSYRQFVYAGVTFAF
jgi:hypothetical protein